MFRNILRPLLTFAVLITTIASLQAAVSPALFQDLRWRLIGPFRGGRVLAVTGVPGEPEHFYFGSVNGGVWETRDAGRTWQPIFESQPIGSIGALEVAPSNHDVIYVGSGEADMRSDIAQGDGMYKSVDQGKTWTRIGLDDSQQIGRILVHPANPDLVYVAALGHPYGPNAERGVFRSRDGGKTWQKVLFKDNDTGAIDLAFEPGNPNVIYASLWQTRRTPWSVYPPSNGPGSGLFKSTDGGDHWTEIKGHGFAPKPGRIGVAVAPSNPRRVYAIVDADKDSGGLYRSDDAGANWSLVGKDERIWSRGWYFGQITIEPKDPDTVYSCNINLLQSTDGGKTWAIVKGAPGGDDYHQMWIDPEHPERRILGVDQGTVVSVNGGKTWSSWYNQATGQFYHVITDNRFPYWVYGSQQDSGAAGIPSRTNTYQGINIEQFREVTAGGESDNVAPDPKNPDIIFGGRVEKLDTRTQQTRLVDPTLPNLAIDRRTWTLPLVFSYRD
ncbi:MAG TPA: glycosyl hydrolase, partial [Rhodothermales bacterium]